MIHLLVNMDTFAEIISTRVKVTKLRLITIVEDPEVEIAEVDLGENRRKKVMDMETGEKTQQASMEKKKLKLLMM